MTTETTPTTVSVILILYFLQKIKFIFTKKIYIHIQKELGTTTQDHKKEEEEEVEPSPEVHFEPVMKLEQLDDIKTFEEDEETLFKM